MRWFSNRAPNRIKKLVAAVALAGASLLATRQELSAQDVLPPSVLECQNCDNGVGGLGGWNLYWHDPTECGFACRCNAGNLTCPSASAPRIFASVEFLPLVRDQLSSVVFAARAVQKRAISSSTSGTPATTTQTTTITTNRFADLTEDDFSNSFDPGMRLSLGVALNDQLRLEGSYIGNYQWSGTAQVSLMDNTSGTPAAIGNLLSPFSHFGDQFANDGLPTLTETQIQTTVGSNPPTTVTTGNDFQPVRGLDYNSLVHVTYTSQLSMSELNLRHRLSNVATRRVAGEASVLIGLRQLTLSETLGYTSNAVLLAPGGTVENHVGVTTNNRFLGMQIGGQTQFLLSQRSWIDFEAKGAILFGTTNCAFSAVSFPAIPNAGGVPFGASEHSTAYLGDLSARYNFQLTPNFTLNAGYNAFFLGGVALASKNLSHDVNALVDGTVQPDHTGRIAFHGPSLGLVWAR